MIYEYTASNRLQEPHNYMYSQFKGQEFLDNYRKDRISRLNALQIPRTAESASPEDLRKSILVSFLVEADSSLLDQITLTCAADVVSSRNANPHEDFSLDSLVVTTKLMDYLFRTCTDATKTWESGSDTEAWLDRLVQRFEVTKKIWSHYRPGFRRGIGEEHEVYLYCRFSLLLAHAYVLSGKLQYLSTLLKVNDLLLSLTDELSEQRGSCCLTLSVAVELAAVARITPAEQL